MRHVFVWPLGLFGVDLFFSHVLNFYFVLSKLDTALLWYNYIMLTNVYAVLLPMVIAATPLHQGS